MQTRSLITIGVLINILFSYLMLLYNQPVNVDGILYVNAADAYLQHGLHGALTVYPWPFYSILMAKLSVLFHTSLLNSGFILNSLFTSLLVIFFILSLKSLDVSPTALLWGAAIILLFPELNHDRFNILRDIPYYSLFMCSLWCYIKLLQTDKFYYGLAWQIVILFSALFRVEGAVFLATIPVLTLFISHPTVRGRINRSLKLCGFNIVAGIVGLMCFRHVLDFGRIPELLASFNPIHFYNEFQQNSVNLKAYLGNLGDEGSTRFLVGGLLNVLLICIINTFGILSTLLLGYGIYTRSLPQEKQAKTALFIYICVNLVILCLFISHLLFMNWRYVFPLVLLLLLFLPTVLDKHKWLGVIYVLYIAVSSFGQFGPSKAYLVEAGRWIDANTPATAQIYSTDILVTFYAQRTETNNLNTANYSVIVHKIHPSTAETPLPAGKTPVASFHNRRGDTAYIYKN